MLEFSKIDKDFMVYKNNNVYLFGASKVGKRCKRILEKNGVHICGFIDNGIEKQGKKFSGVQVISFSDFIRISRDKRNNIIQITSTFERQIAAQIEESGYDNYILYSEFFVRIKQLNMYLASQENDEIKELIYKCDIQNNLRTPVLEGIKDNYFGKKSLFGCNTVDILLSPFTVGNDAVIETVGQNYGKHLIPLNHSYKWMDEEIWDLLKRETIRVVMGVRDPIAHNISLMFQLCENDFWDLEEFWDRGGNVQKIFDEYIIGKNNKRCWYNIYRQKAEYNFLVQDFFEQQIEPFLGIDVYKFPFNKEKGYSILKHENISVFIYQVEKLSGIYKELSFFLDAGDVKPIMDVNLSRDEWYGKVYEEAKKSIILSEEYFENSYSSKYIKHFYDDKDIEKFKNKWKHNVR